MTTAHVIVFSWTGGSLQMLYSIRSERLLIGAVLACVLMTLSFASQRRRARLSGPMRIALLLVVAGLSVCGGCGSGGGTGSGSAMVAPSAYNIQLTVSDGKNNQIQPLMLVVA
jgi:hypothetical protein